MNAKDPYHSDWEAMGLQHYGAQPAPAPKPLTREEPHSDAREVPAQWASGPADQVARQLADAGQCCVEHCLFEGA